MQDLAVERDPRISPALKTGYTYDGTGRLATLTPPGQAAWGFSYDSQGRLSTVSRPDPVNGTATSTIVYDVPTSGTAAPLNMDPSRTSDWGQTQDVPVKDTATAVFGPNHVPAGTTPATLATGDWPYATLTYMDVNGRAVNTASYGVVDAVAGWQITATEYDQFGNTIRSLTAANLAQALTPTAATDPAAAAASSTAARALLLSTTNRYSDDGSMLLDSYGPIHPVQLPTGAVVDARSHTHTVYDEGAPATGGPYRLPTTTVVSAQTTDGTDHEPVTSHTGYGPVTAGDTSGWDLRQPTTKTTQLGANPDPNADLVSKTRYNATGQVVESRLPGGPGGGDSRSTVTTYYAATGTGSCVSPVLAGLVCTVQPGGQPSTGSALPVTTFNYDLYGKVLTKTETVTNGANTTVRTTTTGYDDAERVTSTAVSVTPAGDGGTALPDVSYGYDTSTGLSTTKSTTTGGVTTTLTTGYDGLGRPTSYTDAAGTVSSTGYDIAGRVVSVNDGKASTTYTYDSTSEHRGLLTSLDVGVSPSPATFTATYDADGNLVTQTYPNGLVRAETSDNAGFSTGMTYTMGTTRWMTFTQTPDAHGKIITQSSPQSAQVLSYDGAGRLTGAVDNTLELISWTIQCTTRVYSFDADSNRTALTAHPDDNTSPSTGHCTTATPPGTTTSTFDAADRLTNAGYGYDTLGRTTAVPQADAVSLGSAAWVTGDLAVGYYANDMVASQTQMGQSFTYPLDPTQNRVTGMSYAGYTWTSHYRDDGDNPTWQAVSDGSWVRYLKGIDGDLAGQIDQTGTVTLNLANPHGDIVASVADDPAATGVSVYTESTEYGAPRYPNYTYSVYGWLGSKQRSVLALGGLSFMGVRMYNPATGRFLQVDPVPGGNPNPYTYPVDPINMFDLDGRCGLWGHNTCFSRSKKYVQKHALALTFAAAGVMACLGSAGLGCAVVVGLAAGAAGSGVQYSYDHRNDSDLGSRRWMRGLVRASVSGGIQGAVKKSAGTYLRWRYPLSWGYKGLHRQ